MSPMWKTESTFPDVTSSATAFITDMDPGYLHRDKGKEMSSMLVHHIHLLGV